MSKNDITAGLNPIAMEDINQQISFRSNYIFKLAQKQSDIGVIRPNKGKGTCGYISCLEGLKALGKCPKEMMLDDFTLDFFSKVNDFTVNFTGESQSEFDLMKVKLHNMKESYKNHKFSSSSSWFGEICFYFIAAIYELDVFVYSYAQMRPSRRRESSGWNDDSCTCNVYAFFGGMVTKKAIKNILYPTRDALCIYYRLNHYELLETNPDIIRSQGMQSNNWVSNPTSVSNATSASTVRQDCFIKSRLHKMTHQPFIYLASQATTSSNQGTTMVSKHYFVETHIEITHQL